MIRKTARKLCRDLLFRLLDPPVKKDLTDHEKKLLAQWLASNWQHPGFAIYIANRDRRFMIALSGGVGFTKPSDEDWIKWQGQRVENQFLVSKSETSFKKQVDKRHKGK